MKNNYCVYIHEFPNGKRYVGLTRNTPKKRWNYGIGYKGQPRVYNAIKKYGWYNIEHKILFDELSKEEACEKEKELIKKYKTTDIKYGYNVSFGGEDGGIGLKRTNKQKEYIRKKCRENSGKPIIHLYIDENDIIIGHRVYDSVAEASEHTGTNKNTISKICKVNWCEDYFSFGRIPLEWAYYDDFYKESLLANCFDAGLYRYFLSKEYVSDEFVILMRGNIEFWKKLIKFDKRYKKSSESPVKKVLI